MNNRSENLEVTGSSDCCIRRTEQKGHVLTNGGPDETSQSKTDISDLTLFTAVDLLVALRSFE